MSDTSTENAATTVAAREDPPSVGLWAGDLPPLTAALVALGGVGAILFTAIYLGAGAVRPGYDAWQQPISALSLGPGGWVQQANFALYGALLVLSAVGWYRLLPGQRGMIWYPVLQGIGGLALIGAGIFSMDPFPGYPPGVTLAPSTTHGTLHSILAWVLILALAQSCFAMAAILSRTDGGRTPSVCSYLSGALILIFWGAFIRYPTAPYAGLYERLSAGSHDLWLVALTAIVLARRRARAK
jgi:hypothetical protein